MIYKKGENFRDKEEFWSQIGHFLFKWTGLGLGHFLISNRGKIIRSNGCETAVKNKALNSVICHSLSFQTTSTGNNDRKLAFLNQASS